MSLTVTCADCRLPDQPRQIVQWRQSCRECCDDLVARHQLEFPGHVLQVTGFEASTRTPFGASENIRRLFGQPRRTA